MTQSMVENKKADYPSITKKSIRLDFVQKRDYVYEEAMKILRANIQFSGSNIHVVMITSSLPGEGKSTIALELARSFAQMDKKVLFLDADIRKSMMNFRFAKEDALNGLSQYLSAQKDLGDIVYETNFHNLDMVFAGPYAPNPAELLEDNLFLKLIQYAKKHYEYVIIDTPPMFNLVDASIVARHSDGVALVVESGAVSYKVAQKNLIQLGKSNTKFLGVILNRVPKPKKVSHGKYIKAETKAIAKA